MVVCFVFVIVPMFTHYAMQRTPLIHEEYSDFWCLGSVHGLSLSPYCASHAMPWRSWTSRLVHGSLLLSALRIHGSGSVQILCTGYHVNGFRLCRDALDAYYLRIYSICKSVGFRRPCLQSHGSIGACPGIRIYERHNVTVVVCVVFVIVSLFTHFAVQRSPSHT